MKPAREEIERARDVLLPLPPGGELAELNREGVDALRTLLAATDPDLSADLEAERAAHAETRRERDEAREYVTHQAGDYERRMGHVYKAFTASQDQIKAWQRVTGCPTPEAYSARKVEPTEEQVEQALRLYLATLNAPITADMVELPSPRTGIRAVLRSLSAPTLPSEEEITRAMADNYWKDRTPWAAPARAVLDLVRSRGAAAPPTDEQLAEEAARFANRYTGEPHQDTDMENALRVMRGIDRDEDPTALSEWGRCVRAFVETRREKR